ncbi:MAG: hypothetical protein DMF89_05195, partial [Acidobacteria bacterium]
MGWRAALLDGLTATATMLVAYRLRFGQSEAEYFVLEGAAVLAAVALTQLALGASAGLYRPGGQVMWPVRLAFGAIGGVVLVLLAAFASGVERGVSQQAVASQAALFGLGGALWRSVVGLQVREQGRRAIRERFGHDNLV